MRHAGIGGLVRAHLTSVLREIWRLLPERVRIWRREINAAIYGVRDSLAVVGSRGPSAASALSRQSVRAVPTTAALGQITALGAWLDARSLQHQETSFGMYLRPQPGLDRLLGAPTLHPPDAGVLIAGREGDHAERLLRVANVLHMWGLGPRPYDAFLLNRWGIRRTAITIDAAPDRVAGDAATTVAGIGRQIAAGRLTPRPGARWDHDRFLELDGAGKGMYVGFDSFEPPQAPDVVDEVLNRDARSDLHFGSEYASRGGRYLYQSVPTARAGGRRNSLRRWDRIRSMLAEAGQSIEERLVLDIGCNAGMMLAAALAEGASWGLGWDRPQVVRHGRLLLPALGYSRFELAATELHERYPLLDDVPEFLHPGLDGAAVLYLAIRHHIGFLTALGQLPWQVLVYEGGEEESLATLPQHLAGLRAICDFSIGPATDFRDGETRRRPLAVLTRR